MSKSNNYNKDVDPKSGDLIQFTLRCTEKFQTSFD
jgi:hypothetical protein